MSIILSALSVATVSMRMEILAIPDSFPPIEPVWFLAFCVLAACGWYVLSKLRVRLLLCGVVFAVIMGIWEALGYSLELYQGIYGLVATHDQMVKAALKLIGTAWIAFVVFVAICLLAGKLQNLKGTIRIISRNRLLFLWPVIFCCWLPYFFTWYPAIIAFDSAEVVHQAITGIHERSIPVFHLALTDVFMQNSALSDITSAAAVYAIFQMAIMSGIFAYAIYKLAGWRIPMPFLVAVAICFIVVPVYAIFTITLWKDTLFGGFVLLFVVCVIDFVYTRGENVKKKSNIVIYIISAIGMLGFRFNGLHVFIFTVIIIFIAIPFMRKRFALVSAISLALYFLVSSMLVSATGAYVETGVNSSYAIISIPLQQIGRIVTLRGDELLPQEQEFVNELFSKEGDAPNKDVISTVAQEYDPYLSDNMYLLLNQDWVNQNPGAFFRGWSSLIMKYPSDATVAVLVNNFGYWWPEESRLGDNFTSGSNAAIQQFGLGAQNYNADDMTIRSNHMDQLIKFFTATPFGILFRVSMPAIVCLFLVTFLIYRKQRSELVLLAPVIGLWLTCLVGPLNAEYRYMFGAFCALPVLIAYYFGKDYSWKNDE